jgi:hypothetical protein
MRNSSDAANALGRELELPQVLVRLDNYAPFYFLTPRKSNVRGDSIGHQSLRG